MKIPSGAGTTLLIPKLQVMENEVSEDPEIYFEETDTQFQLLPPHMHWINAAEQAVRKFKNHFISALCTVNPHFTFYLWDGLLPQDIITLNMFWRYQLNPGISEYEQVEGVHNFYCTPLATLGCRVKINKNPHQQRTYAPHIVYGW